LALAGLLSPAAFVVFFNNLGFEVHNCLSLHSVTTWMEMENLSSKSLINFKHGGRSFLFKNGSADLARRYNTEYHEEEKPDTERSTVFMMYKATMSDVSTDLRPSASFYTGQPVGDVVISPDQIPIYPMPLIPYTACPVTPASKVNVVQLDKTFTSFSRSRLNRNSPLCFSSLSDQQLDQCVAEWNDWKRGIDMVVADPENDPDNWTMCQLMATGSIIGEAAVDADAAGAIARQVRHTAALALLRRLSPKAKEITTKALREAKARLVVEQVDEMRDPDGGGASALPGGRGRGRGTEGAGRVRGGGRAASRGRGQGRGQPEPP
jgi:hypothetical protein